MDFEHLCIRPRYLSLCMYRLHFALFCFFDRSLVHNVAVRIFFSSFSTLHRYIPLAKCPFFFIVSPSARLLCSHQYECICRSSFFYVFWRECRCFLVHTATPSFIFYVLVFRLSLLSSFELFPSPVLDRCAGSVPCDRQTSRNPAVVA